MHPLYRHCESTTTMSSSAEVSRHLVKSVVCALFWRRMNDEPALLENIKKLVQARKYRIRLHAVRHMIEEGFDERDLLEALGGKSRILERYSNEMRCLILGYFTLTERLRIPLHVVCDYSNPTLVDIITAYVPQKPWWITPAKRGRLT